MRDAVTHRGGRPAVAHPSRIVGVLLIAGVLAVGYGFTVDGMLRPQVGPRLLVLVMAWFGVVGLALLALPERTEWLIAPALFSGYPVWVAAGHAVNHPELLLTSAYLIFVLGSLAALGSTRWFVAAMLATMPVLTIGLWRQYPTGQALALRVVGDGLTLMMISAAVFQLSRRQVRLAHRLHDLAGSDPLTLLPNRRRLDELAPTILVAAREAGALVAVLILDLDHFKQVNDRHGHATGDQVLIAVAEDLAALLGPGAVLARTGGEELLALTMVADPGEARTLGERVRRLVADGSSPVPVTCSMGVAAVAPPAPGVDRADAAGWLWAVAAVADQAMYEAKLAGRNRVVLASATSVPPPRAPAPRAPSGWPVVGVDPRARFLRWSRALRRAWASPARAPSTADTAIRLLGMRLAGGMALASIGLLVLVLVLMDRGSDLLAPGRLPQVLFTVIVIHGLGIGLIAMLRPGVLPRVASVSLVFGCLSWSMAPVMYRSPELFVTPVQLLMICSIAAMVTGTRGFVAVLLTAVPALSMALSHNDYPPSVLPGQVVLNGVCVLVAALGIHLLRLHNERVQERLQVLSVTDPLTCLPNRRQVQDRAPALLARAASGEGQVAALLIDLDRFKEINDRHGHATGDQVLIAVTEAILARLGAGDLLARAGGEEFLMLSVVTDLDRARDLAEQVRGVVGQLSEPVPVTCSIGVAAAVPGEGAGEGDEAASEWVWSLTAVADRAMYEAKLAGRNRVIALDPTVPAGDGEAGPRPDGVTPGRQVRRVIGVRAVRPEGTIG